ncbi:hypothetical protein [Streptomyces huiliensis]|uniref:hypothetical protein n=1 Tax=Streptomyces huiliensis TaxID=2876027 RepID=UPI001CBB784D|nr:hypothetical protein [Streptomyces huiliensis]MBZ4318565.1 hypothetical protein [Streptomyces huiliensis]
MAWTTADVAMRVPEHTASATFRNGCWSVPDLVADGTVNIVDRDAAILLWEERVQGRRRHAWR